MSAAAAVKDLPPVYTERLAAPWWWWPFGLLVAGIVAAEVHGGADGLLSVLPYAICLPVAVAVLVHLSRAKIVLTADGLLRVKGARIPVDHLAGGTAYDPKTSRAMLRGADPLAFTSIRPFVGTGVHLEVDDPTDDTPYWLVSSRRPEELLRSISAVRRSLDNPR